MAGLIVNEATALTEVPLVGETETLGGHERDGRASSITDKGNEQEAVLLALSVAVQVTVVVVETINVEPDIGQTLLLMPDPSMALTTESNETTGVGELSDDFVA